MRLWYGLAECNPIDSSMEICADRQESWLPAVGDLMGGSPKSLPLLRIQALGPPQVLLGDTEITFRRTKALALLVYLAVSRRAYPRDALVALVTDAGTRDVAKTRFRAVLADLHREVGAYLLVGRQSVALAPERPLWLDLAELEAAVADVATPAAPARLAAAVALYRGDFLAGLSVTHAPAFEAWLLTEREHAQTLLVRALARLSGEAEQAGDAPAAMQWARRLLEHAPWDEAAHRRLMRLLAQAGEREAALAQYVTCRRVLEVELGTVPQPETSALVAELRAGPLAPPSNLPVPSPGFLGREAALALLAKRLADPACRLLTVRGLGGSGKSSLALQAATRQACPVLLRREHRFADGIYLVDLAGVIAPLGQADAAGTAARRLAVAIGCALGLEVRGTDPVAPLADWLGPRAVLLLLDNMEQLLAGTALLRRLVQRCPRLALLVTSRVALGVPEEWVLDLQGLALPATPHDVEQAAASRVFLQRLRQQGRGMPPAAADREAIVQICRLTQGLPLALLLTAQWAPVLSLAAIARELEAGLDLLAPAGGLRLPERQRDMREVLQATWVRLRVPERQALRRLAVFQPGFTREAAQAVAGVASDVLLQLGEGALVERDTVSARYTVAALVQRYAAEQLARHPKEQEATRTTRRVLRRPGAAGDAGAAAARPGPGSERRRPRQPLAGMGLGGGARRGGSPGAGAGGAGVLAGAARAPGRGGRGTRAGGGTAAGGAGADRRPRPVHAVAPEHGPGTGGHRTPAQRLRRAGASQASAALALCGQRLLPQHEGDEQGRCRCAEEAGAIVHLAELRQEEQHPAGRTRATRAGCAPPPPCHRRLPRTGHAPRCGRRGHRRTRPASERAWPPAPHTGSIPACRYRRRSSPRRAGSAAGAQWR
jgi:DNA-binding SARP family transcriptional activator/predicted ATPase